MKKHTLSRNIGDNQQTQDLLNDLYNNQDITLVISFNNGGCVETASKVAKAISNFTGNLEVSVEGYAKSMAAYIYCHCFMENLQGLKKKIKCKGGFNIHGPFLMLHKTRLKVNTGVVFIDEIISLTNTHSHYLNLSKKVDDTFHFYMQICETPKRQVTSYDNFGDVLVDILNT
ncbi:hypothetical protein [Vibrio parahaemolyticus]|uniref:hypothetical protein n=1 Tax=Vibrio parahaemolyticus TaxID=670 RepID=UPI0018696EA4|nr:hypothetical protein [Vibrio parahaemolyticus]MBE3933024.1 hypothetical protein [Vibrio parahaemolyticus]MBE4044228.1 hypothetical protein [Vibrio parahaemolyticus]MCG6442198.1 hypothetical protein [Vibrio parahaemolyticus]MCG6455589.1 hypothetical protein [Vibrio parahaemolyticus]HCH1968131.1 hypothetical protein [Vibrio parahaemolyticus]